MSRRVAVIDVGSISIKALVAGPDSTGPGLVKHYESTREVRISKGISGNPPVLADDRIRAGAETVAALITECERHGPLEALSIVATSAVRSAVNGGDFAMAVQAATGHPLEVLSGDQEAEAIAMGVQTDPAIGSTMDKFTVFDLGGGSLELIRFEEDSVITKCSLPLGSVRLTERFISDPGMPVPRDEQLKVLAFLESALTGTFKPLQGPLVGCSGGLAVLRKTLADKAGISFEDFPPFFQKKHLGELTRTILGQSLEERIRITGLPPERADVFPVALLTFQVLLDLTQADGILHSVHNLRFGIARKLLHPVP